MTSSAVAIDPEIVRLRAENISLHSRVRELEEALLRCHEEAGVALRDVLLYYDDVPRLRSVPNERTA